jgi:hypothetical protein
MDLRKTGFEYMNLNSLIILWYTGVTKGNSVNNNPFLDNKHVPMAVNTHVTTELLLETGCFQCGPC